MVTAITVDRKTFYACDVCKYVYEQRKTAEKCQDYCEKNKV
jgi:rubredoxin